MTATTPAGKRLKRQFGKFFGDTGDDDVRYTDKLMVDWDECARAVLDSVDRDRLPHERDEEHLLALAMEGEWGHFMNATPEAWSQKAQSIRARMEHIKTKENTDMANETPLAPLIEDDIEKITEWVDKWRDEFIPLAELPDTWVLSDRGVIVKMTRSADEDESGPSRPIVVEGHYVGQTTYEVGLAEDTTGIAQRVDIIFMSGSAFPLRRDSLIEVDGVVVWAPEE